MKPKIIRRKKETPPREEKTLTPKESPKANPTKPKPQKKEVKRKTKRERLSTENLLSEINSLDRDAFEKLMQGPKKIRTGDQVEGVIVRATADMYVLDLQAKSEAFLWKSEAENKDLKIGDHIEAQVISISSNGILLSQKTAEAQNKNLLEAKENRTPIPALVTAVNQGGYQLLAFGMKGFCPKSQMDFSLGPDEEYLNQTFEFIIKDIQKQEFVAFRKPILEQDQKEKQQLFLTSLQQGSIWKGVVRRNTDFGIFISIDNQIDGLLPRKKIPPHTNLLEGESVQVRIENIDIQNRKVALALNQRDPWQDVGSQYKCNIPYRGKVHERIEHGLLVSLEFGLIGLVHNSKLPAKNFVIGEEITVYITSFDIASRKMRLSLEASVIVQETQPPTQSLADLMQGLFSTKK